MYIAHVGDQYIVKRMPMSGGSTIPSVLPTSHQTSCPVSAC